MSTDEACSEVIRLERQLLDPEVRRQPDLVRALLHPEFVEFGASGRVWNAESIIDALASAKTSEEMTATDFMAVSLAVDVILLTFKTENTGRTCLRSSVWIRSEGDKWHLRFHQGTIIDE